MRLYSNWKFAGNNKTRKKSARFIKVKQNWKLQTCRKTLAIICSSLLGLVLSFTRTDRYKLVCMEISYSIKTQVQVLRLKMKKCYWEIEKCYVFAVIKSDDHCNSLTNRCSNILQTFSSFIHCKSQFKSTYFYLLIILKNIRRLEEVASSRLMSEKHVYYTIHQHSYNSPNFAWKPSDHFIAL